MFKICKHFIIPAKLSVSSVPWYRPIYPSTAPFILRVSTCLPGRLTSNTLMQPSSPANRRSPAGSKVTLYAAATSSTLGTRGGISRRQGTVTSQCHACPAKRQRPLRECSCILLVQYETRYTEQKKIYITPENHTPESVSRRSYVFHASTCNYSMPTSSVRDTYRGK